MRRIRLPGEHGQADLAVEQPALHLPAVADQQGVLDPRVLPEEAGEQRWQQVGTDGAGAGDDEGADGQSLHLPDRGDGLLGEQEDPPGVVGEDLALGGRPDPGPGAVDERGLE